MNKQVYDAFWGSTLRTTTKAHRWLHRVSGGRWGRHFPGGVQVIWVQFVGRKSGIWRRTPLLTVPAEGQPAVAREVRAWVVAGSNVGQAKLPAWVGNLRAHPDGFAEVNTHHYRCRFVELVDGDRDVAYARLVSAWRGFAMYQRNAGRYIPVFEVRLGDELPAASVPAEGAPA